MTMVHHNKQYQRSRPQSSSPSLSLSPRHSSSLFWFPLLILLNCTHEVSGFFQNFVNTIAGSTTPTLPFQQEKQRQPPIELNEIQSLLDMANTPPNIGILSKPQEERLKSLMLSINQNSRKVKGNRDDPRRFLPTSDDYDYWELLYTTEKEVNFFKTSWPFKDALSSITQTLDLYNDGTINNSINFNQGKSYFAVDGTVRPVEVLVKDDDGNGDEAIEYVVDRVEFTFTKATICINEGLKFDVPPVGAGWFDTLYCDGKYRLSYDSRGDYSVFIRRK